MLGFIRNFIICIISSILFVNLSAQERANNFEHKPGPEFDYIPFYDKDSEKRIELFPQSDSTLAYIAQKGDNWVAVIDGMIGEEYDKIEQLNASDNHYHYFAQKGKKWVVAYDGIESVEFDRLCKAMPKYHSNSKRLIYAGKNNDKWTVCINDKQETGYDEILDFSLSFSDDGSRYAYAAEKDGDWLVIVDGVPGHSFEEIQLMSMHGLFAAPENQVVYAGKRDKWHLVLDSTIGPAHEMINFWNIDAIVNSSRVEVIKTKSSYTVWRNNYLFHQKSGRTAYRISKKHYNWVVIDGKLSPKYKMDISYFGFSRDGNHHAYVAQNIGYKQNLFLNTVKKAYYKAFMVSNGIKGEEFNRITNPIFLPGDTMPTYGAISGKKFCLISNGNKSDVYEDWLEGSPYYNERCHNDKPGSCHLAYCIKKDGSWHAVVDDWFSPPYKGIDTVVFSPDGENYGYIALEKDRPFYVINGKPEQEYTNVFDLIFSEENNHYIYWANNKKKWIAVRDGQPSQEYDDAHGSPQLSPNGEHFAYAVKLDKEYFIVLDGENGPAFDDISAPQFSPDGKTLAYVAQKGNKWSVVTVDLN